jgi:hypothetical protein
MSSLPGRPSPPEAAQEPAKSASGLLRGLLDWVRESWDEAQGYQRLAYLVGVVLLGAGLVHAVIWAVAGGSVSGPLSWRKPATFGISFGLATLTLGWVAGWLPVKKTAARYGAGLLCASTSVEVAWVSLQHARQVPSHFNNTSTFDFSLFVIGGVAIVVTMVVIVAMTVAAFGRTTAPPPLALAIRAGLLGLLTGEAIGAWMIVHGMALVNSGADARTGSLTTSGDAGAMKDAHAVPLHAIQVLIVLALLLSRSGLPERRQLQLVAVAVTGYAALFTVLLVRTGAGLRPLELSSYSTVGYLVSAALIAVPFLMTTTRHLNHRSPPRQ